MTTLYRRRLAWAMRPRLAWLTLAMIIATVLVMRSTEPHIRWWGTFLQLVGIGTVVYELRSSLELFGRDLVDEVRRFFRSWPTWNVTVHLGSANLRMQGGSLGVAVGTSPAAPGTPLEQRVAILEQALATTQQSVGQLSKDLSDEKKAREAGDEAESAQRDAVIAKLRGEVVLASTGSAWMSIFGVSWLAVGVILAGTSTELSRLFR